MNRYFSDLARTIAAAEHRADEERKVFDQIRALQKMGLIEPQSRGDRGAYMIDTETACLARILIACQEVYIVGDALERARNLLVRGARPQGALWSLSTATEGIRRGEDWLLLVRLPQHVRDGGFVKIQPVATFQGYFDQVLNPQEHHSDRPRWQAAISATALLKPIIAAEAAEAAQDAL